jgi:hypothetical protein
MADGLGVALDEHAESTIAAATANALMRRVPLINSVSPHLWATEYEFILLPGSDRMVEAAA